MSKSLTKEQQLAREAVPHLILRLSVPAITGVLVISLYGIMDAWFISKLGTSAIGAVGVAFSISMLYQAIGYTLGNGAGSLLSRALGAGDRQAANGLSAYAFWLALLLGTALGALGLCFLAPLLRLLGATESIYPYAHDYAVYLLCAAPVVCASFTLNNLLRSAGRVTRASVAFAVGNLLNIFLDPLLIFSLDMGCAGAAMATLISQSTALIILLAAFLSGNAGVSLHPKHLLIGVRRTGEIFTTGLPSLLRQGFAGVASALTTHQAALFGDGAIAALSVVSRLFQLLYSFCVGIGQALMPAAGYCKGAGDLPRTGRLYRFALWYSSILMPIVAIPTALLAERVIGLFDTNPTVIAWGSYALRFTCAALILHGPISVTNLFLQATGHRFSASLLAGARQGLFFLPLILWVPSAFGITGLLLTQPLADLLTFLLSVPLLLRCLRSYPVKRTPQPARA
ncbi:MAG: MATE family efflux transporter [Ruminococcaceae bacterium]|nr:MATE family efflux transporter [Oscillospiraceae bacterium]